MNPSLSKAMPIAAGALGLIAAFYVAFFRPGTFGNFKHLAALLMLEFLLVALWHYEKVFFPVLMLSFLWAGISVPLSSVGGTVRWVVLGVAAAGGLVMWMRDQRHTYGLFHFVGLCCIAAALASSAVSETPRTSLLKALSLLLLFLYGATGARLAMLGREVNFTKGLLLACEVLVYVSAIAYLMGLKLFGNPNSLGAVMGVVVIPFVFWGALASETRAERYRRAAALLIAGVLLYDSLSRASMLAATVAVVALCIMLRRTKLLLQGAFFVALFVAGAALVNPTHFDEFVQSVTSNVLYKGKEESGILGSRRSPWEGTIAAIKEHPLFGTGFGTSYMGQFGLPAKGDLAATTPAVSTRIGTNREHGNSYLALVEYMGLLGIIPFAILLMLVVLMIVRIGLWMRETGNPYPCAVPFAMVLLAGLVHVFFEDWLMAVGYYLCVFFWTSAFLLHDMIPARSRARVVRPAPIRVEGAPSYGSPVTHR